ncbi:MAG: glycosyltransferase, partial [Pseudomonadota bacterium]|nr:glycosyltransferase [Pseudomonadota bacterium]
MKILHLSSERNWRGGENQLVLLVSNLPGNIGSIVAAPKGSAILSRLEQGFETREIACRGALDIRSVFVVRRLVKDRGIDLIHAHTSKAHEVGLLACFLTGIPLVVSRRVAFPISGGWKYRRADRLIAVSAAASAELRKVGVPPARIVVIHDAVDPKAAQESRAERAGASGSEVLVLCAAAFAGEKDHQLLLDAWRIVEDSAPRGRLHLAGDGPLRDSIVEGIRKRGLKRVHLLGWRNDVAQLLQGADIVTLSSREEGFASVLCEAQMKGKPVVATRAGG